MSNSNVASNKQLATDRGSKLSSKLTSKASSASHGVASKSSSKHKKDRKESVGSFTTGDRSKSTIAKLRAQRLFKKRNELKIYFDNDDVTPSMLNTLGSFNKPVAKDKRSTSHIDIMKSTTTTGDGVFSTLAASTLNLQTQIQSINISMFTSNTTSSSLIRTQDAMISHDSISWLKESDEDFQEVSEVPEKVETMMPSKVNLVLTETPVTYLYELPSVSAEKDTEEGIQVEQENENYDYLTVGKGRNRKTCNAEIQTNDCVLKTRCTQAERCKRKNSYSFASGWDMLDTYNGISQIPQGKTIYKKVPLDTDPDYPKYLEQLTQQMIDLIHYPNFQEAVIVMERILANNVYNEEQKRFRGLIEQDPFRPDIQFKYNISLLWTFKNCNTEGHPVTSMHWNPANDDILAVGYGKFFYNDQKNGFVYCWNIKNPTQPEREIYYTKPVTSVAFSTCAPNILAVGLYDGHVEILDITYKDVVMVATTTPNFSPSHSPIWQVAWLPPDDYNNEEILTVVGDDGRISKLTRSKTTEFLSTPLMKTLPIEGKLKGVYQPRHCPVTDVPLSKCSAALLITKHPTDPNKYFIGTDEGTIHRCSKHFVNQHIDMFMAHNGPVYSCQFSPFCNKLFLTCGADWCINIWTENVLEPLITLAKSTETVEGACWSPMNSSIIANIVGQEIKLWDLQRRTYQPAAVHKTPSGCRNTLIQFTKSGRNLVIADIDGNVHIFALEDMPFPPFYQAEMLVNVIKKTLVVKQDIIDQLDSIC